MPDLFSPITNAANVMSGYSYPWLIAGGWSIDLYLGRVTREHKDVDIAVFRRDQLHLQSYFAGWHLYIAHDGQLLPWQVGEYLNPPLHGIWAYSPDHPPPHTPDINPDLDFLLDNLTPSGRDWQFRRDASITRPLADVIMWTSERVPYLAPEIALLYKARYQRPEDSHDFNVVLAALEPDRRAWLKLALEVTSPGHAWLQLL